MDSWERKRVLPFGTQGEVVKATGFSKGFVSEVVNGKANPTDEARRVAVKLARKAGLPVRKMFPELYNVA